MSHQEEPQSPKAEEPRPASPDLSDKETETFEDAPSPDTGSVRSLTRRNTSQSRRLTNDRPEHDTDKDEIFKGTPEGEAPNEPALGSQEKPSPRISVASLDNVNLDDDSAQPPKDEDKKASDHHPPKSISLSSITNSLPTMPWSPPPTTDSPTKSGLISPPPPPPARKISSAFSWLSRSHSSKDKDAPATSPPAISPRRNTASSVTTLTSNPEMMLSKLDEEKDGDMNGSRSSLKDRFKLLRMREEAGVVLPADDDKHGSAIASLVARTGTVGLGVLSPSTVLTDEKDGGLALPPASPIPPSPNHTLAPGTASGATAGPSEDPSVPVDWDLWQSVVYEGPAAVARTSPEELNKAIATGIPNAIRGVIWQVLAQSKNQDLEQVYRELVAMGTDKENNRHSNGTSGSGTSQNSLGIQQEPASSASSVHSDKSGANGSSSPTNTDSEASLKAQAIAAAERKKRDKVDAAQLQKLEKIIRKDLGARTSYSKFAAAQGLQEGLFGVCKAYALFDKPVGYAQGMNFLIMPLLFNMPEEEAFCLLVRLMNHYHLRDVYIEGMPGLHLQLYQFERLLEDLEPALYCHLHRRGISSHLYATQWFLTLFSYRFPLQLVLRIYDLIFSEGLSAILRFGIVLMQKNAEALLAMKDMSQLCTFLRDRLFDVYIDAAPSSNSILENGFFGSSSSGIDKEIYRADQLIRDACEVKITPELLKSYTAEWEEKTRAEKERELELETLRSSNAGYAVRVRKLEERIEAVDREQAALATELVHTKVQNEELKDENESLKGQVRELKIVIEKQPAELEEAWRLERDDLMKRNERVHEENQKLEKEMSELEEELVQTKMKYAEINAQHETLQRRWTDLKRQFD
ncbi:RabGAP/TBC [Coniochaeta hoffmannii]|uniref:GTPase-activating protein GYP5 n=1 Tax=Coniochaeta hoffmannii TaxID=91930 RepID=A0AA38VQF4_9PEZI|nr:RabGAP/TBC [Coniochaeta hoffmannii]